MRVFRLTAKATGEEVFRLTAKATGYEGSRPVSDDGIPAGLHSQDSIVSGDGLVAELARIADPQARLQRVVDLARARPAPPESVRSDAHRVHGCQVRLWFAAERRDGRCWFACDSDAASLKALVGLLCALHSGKEPAAIPPDPASDLERLGLLRQLAESRRATVLRVAAMLRDFASGTVSATGDGTSCAPG